MRNSKVYRIIALLLAAVLITAGCRQQAPDISADDCAAVLLEAVPEPAYNAVGGEWVVIGLARWGGEVPQAWFDGYYERLEAHLQSCGGVLHERKYSEYARVILALTAMGRDPANVGGYNLLEPLADYDQTVFQGINGPIWALLALDSGGYDIPANPGSGTQATRELYVEHILSRELSGGGWSLAGSEPEVDLTAMALQALAKYADRPDAAAAIERGVAVLSAMQNENGGYSTYDAETSESIAQVILALTALGIRCDDSRFVKNGRSLAQRLLDFRADDGGFRHTLDTRSDLIATQQAFCALVALERMEQGQKSFYDMT